MYAETRVNFPSGSVVPVHELGPNEAISMTWCLTVTVSNNINGLLETPLQEL